MRGSVPVILLMSTIATAHGQPSSDCRSIRESVERLRCYDAREEASDAQKPRQPASKATAPDATVTKARAAVAHSLRDPPSARFDGIVRKPEAVCGYVNGKNAYGGYTGRTRFAYVLKSGEIFIEFSPALMTPQNVNEWDRIDKALTRYCPGVKSPFIKD